MEPSDAFDVESLLIYQTLYEDGSPYREVIEVREFHVAKALLEGHQESLGVLVESNKRLVHIFDLCMEFGHTDTAWALVHYGVAGCPVRVSDLGPYAKDRHLKGCCINATERCDCCTFGWQIDQGTWMKDWDADLGDAADAACEAVHRNPFLREIMSNPDTVVEDCFSAEGMARLLDIAILTGDKEAAVHLSRRCQLWPLRCWRADDLFRNRNFFDCRRMCQDQEVETVIAALAAGADIHRMYLMPRETPIFPSLMDEIIGRERITFQTAVFLSGNHRWHECVGLCPPPSEKSGLRRLRCSNSFCHCRRCWNSFGRLCLDFDHRKELHRLSREKVRAVVNLGIDLKDVRCQASLVHTGTVPFCPVPFSTLLGLAIMCGEPDCAVECVRNGVNETGWEWEERQHITGELSELQRRLQDSEFFNDELQRHLRDETNSVRNVGLSDGQWSMEPIESPALACRHAAQVAATAALRASWKREAADKRAGIIQLWKKMLEPKRSFPMPIVDDILFFSMEVPKFVDQLDLWDLVDGWMTPAAAVRAESEVRNECGESCEPPSSDQPGSSNGAAAHAGSGDVEMEDVKVDEQTTQDLLTAVRDSRAEVPPLNAHGVYVFRLTRMATSSHINDLLLDAEGPLAELHSRVLAAGCEVNPDWSPVKALFVPMTEAQMAELQDLAGQGYELNKNDHILALRDDHSTIEGALKSLPRRIRPKVRKVGPQAMDAEEHPEDDPDEADAGPWLVMEGGLRTDSDIGFGEYQL